MPDLWSIVETEFNPLAQHAQEAVFCIGNGYLSTRGAFEEGYPGQQPATLIHGVFDDVPIVVTELANAPNWLPLVPIIDGEPLRLDRGEILDYRRTLDLRRGILERSFCWRSPRGHTVQVRFERLASFDDPHVLALRCQLTVLDQATSSHPTPASDSLSIEFHASLDGDVTNDGVEHWNRVAQGAVDRETVYLQSRTRHTGIQLCAAARLVLDGAAHLQYATRQTPNRPTVAATVEVAVGQTVTTEKVVTLFTSNDVGRRVRAAALTRLAEVTSTAGAFDRLAAASQRAWAQYWDTCDIEIEGDDEAQIATRYSLFQLLIAAPRDDEYVSIAAKTLSGFGYRGHVFWDTETFILPFFIFTQPAIARNLLLYRYHTLSGARRKAREGGYAGAQFAWESAVSGEEVTPQWVPGPDGRMVRIWTGDIELHITADVVYAVWLYWRATGDDDFMSRYGAELILDTAQFWSTRAEWNAAENRYEFTDVIGPDEYHEHVDNNVYTNYLVRWHLHLALDILSWLQQRDPHHAAELAAALGITDSALAKWREVIEKLYINYHPATRLYEQFDGYFDRTDVDLPALEPRDKSVQALLGIEGTNQTQVLKQPDVLMLIYMLPDEFDAATAQANWDYYTPRTDLTHGSSLAPGIQAILACRMGDTADAYHFYMQAALVDLKDLRLNTNHGLHGAAMGAVWQASVFGFGGVRLTDSGVVTEPRLPSHWRSLKFKLFYHGRLHSFTLGGS